MSKGKKFVALELLTFIVLIVARRHVGTSRPADPTGPAFTGLGNFNNASQMCRSRRSGINTLALRPGTSVSRSTSRGRSITGFLVLFMQVGFAFLVTGLPGPRTRRT